ncbi:hypothetical protein [Brevibacillus agri]|uniref:hypothetical protein n=1 Tax=Brevibacillus agri TaxID=51101 RepID=UPI003D262DBE
MGRVAAGGWLFVLGWMGRGVVIRRSIRLFACSTVHSFIRRLLGLVPVLSGALLIGVVGGDESFDKVFNKKLQQGFNKGFNKKTQ